MRVAIVHHQYAKKGGMETYLFDISKGFAAHGDIVTVITCVVDRKSPKYNSWGRIIKRKIWLPRVWRRFYFMQGINKSFIGSDYDLSLSLTRTATQNAVICGGTHLGYLRYLRKTPRLKDKIEIYLERKSYAKSPYIVAHSNMLKDELVELYDVPKEKIRLFYPPIDTNVFSCELRQNRQVYKGKFSLSDKKINLLFPSTGHVRKGWNELYQAMKVLPSDQFELIVVGNKVASQQGNIRSLGYVHNMAELYTAVDFTILPSHYEPYGLVVSESLQCRTPVIISNKVGAKDFVTKDNGIIIEEVTPKAIVDAILKAEKQNFVLTDNFAEKHGLTLINHIDKLRALINE